MKFLIDVNVPNSTISLFKKLGYDVLDLKQVHLLSSDIEVIKLAQAEDRIIVTRDKDFLELSNFPKYKVPLIVIRVTNQKFENITEHLSNLLKNQTEKVLKKSITIVKEEIAESYPLQ